MHIFRRTICSTYDKKGSSHWIRKRHKKVCLPCTMRELHVARKVAKLRLHALSLKCVAFLSFAWIIGFGSQYTVWLNARHLAKKAKREAVATRGSHSQELGANYDIHQMINWKPTDGGIIKFSTLVLYFTSFRRGNHDCLCSSLFIAVISVVILRRAALSYFHLLHMLGSVFESLT